MTATVSHSGLDEASPWVARFAPQAPPGEVLDLACGGGRHARLFAQLGHAVVAVDRDPAALQRAAGERIETVAIDLEGSDDAARDWPFGADRFAAIVVTNYLHRPLFPLIFTSLAPGGLLIYETFAQGNGQFGKPSNPAFLLAPGELIARVAEYVPQYDLRIVAFEDGYLARPKPAMVQRICVAKGISGRSEAFRWAI